VPYIIDGDSGEVIRPIHWTDHLLYMRGRAKTINFEMLYGKRPVSFCIWCHARMKHARCNCTGAWVARELKFANDYGSSGRDLHKHFGVDFGGDANDAVFYAGGTPWINNDVYGRHFDKNIVYDIRTDDERPRLRLGTNTEGPQVEEGNK
jgi:hypothetical protein